MLGAGLELLGRRVDGGHPRYLTRAGTGCEGRSRAASLFSPEVLMSVAHDVEALLAQLGAANAVPVLDRHDGVRWALPDGLLVGRVNHTPQPPRRSASVPGSPRPCPRNGAFARSGVAGARCAAAGRRAAPRGGRAGGAARTGRGDERGAGRGASGSGARQERVVRVDRSGGDAACPRRGRGGGRARADARRARTAHRAGARGAEGRRLGRVRGGGDRRATRHRGPRCWCASWRWRPSRAGDGAAAHRLDASPRRPLAGVPAPRAVAPRSAHAVRARGEGPACSRPPRADASLFRPVALLAG